MNPLELYDSNKEVYNQDTAYRTFISFNYKLVQINNGIVYVKYKDEAVIAIRADGFPEIVK